MDNESLTHTTWNCKYHIVFAPKYRRQVFYKQKKYEIGKILRKLCEWKGIEIFEGDIIEGDYKTKYVVSHSDYDLSFIGVSNDGDDYGPYTLRLSAKGTKRVIGNIHTNPELLTQK